MLPIIMTLHTWTSLPICATPGLIFWPLSFYDLRPNHTAFRVKLASLIWNWFSFSQVKIAALPDAVHPLGSLICQDTFQVRKIGKDWMLQRMRLMIWNVILKAKVSKLDQIWARKFSELTWETGKGDIVHVHYVRRPCPPCPCPLSTSMSGRGCVAWGGGKRWHWRRRNFSEVL